MNCFMPIEYELDLILTLILYDGSIKLSCVKFIDCSSDFYTMLVSLCVSSYTFTRIYV